MPAQVSCVYLIFEQQGMRRLLKQSTLNRPVTSCVQFATDSYYVAPPRMKLYKEYSTKVYSIYLKYIAPEDIHVYSIDEVFIVATYYLATYYLTAHELAMTMIRKVLYTTGITATAGIGMNLYIAKVAMDIVAKHVPADKDGVRIADLLINHAWGWDSTTIEYIKAYRSSTNSLSSG